MWGQWGWLGVGPSTTTTRITTRAWFYWDALARTTTTLGQNNAQLLGWWAWGGVGGGRPLGPRVPPLVRQAFDCRRRVICQNAIGCLARFVFPLCRSIGLGNIRQCQKWAFVSCHFSKKLFSTGILLSHLQKSWEKVRAIHLHRRGSWILVVDGEVDLVTLEGSTSQFLLWSPPNSIWFSSRFLRLLFSVYSTFTSFCIMEMEKHVGVLFEFFQNKRNWITRIPMYPESVKRHLCMILGTTPSLPQMWEYPTPSCRCYSWWQTHLKAFCRFN